MAANVAECAGVSPDDINADSKGSAEAGTSKEMSDDSSAIAVSTSQDSEEQYQNENQTQEDEADEEDYEVECIVGKRKRALSMPSE